MTAHGWTKRPTTSGPLAGRPTDSERCEFCTVRRTPAAEQASCPPEWEIEGQL